MTYTSYTQKKSQAEDLQSLVKKEKEGEKSPSLETEERETKDQEQEHYEFFIWDNFINK